VKEKNQIISILKSTEALLDGHFILTSGRHSSTYFQCAKVLQFPEYLTAFSIMISDRFVNTKPDIIISPAIGGIVLSTEVGVQLGCKSIFSERQNGKMILRRGFEIIKSQKVLIVEDVITTGGSVKEVMDLVLASDALIVGVGVLVDRSNGKVKLHKNQYSIVKLDAKSYGDDEIPDSLAKIPIQKPGSRYLL
tara:strand:+ start:4027 stop:4605 length:579 start_codon:yes stop_codon:yes gene_type:complete